ncbi:hypothetical protein QYE76_052839 [Lolium multiflorum]|uniref:Reverse transcriptase Ty1/copia-type domain-containing protein n=1 Tax=Lolium multiflorum TaxID=4521 RepID=A0AAD8SW32_LOLMU|nr:hypothetical protein QYE76_052839 [Lolium multiflorum]
MVEPLKVYDALEDPNWLLPMQEELNNFKRNDVWTLMKRPNHCHNVIGNKWVFKNNQDEHGIVICNKARLVVEGYSQVEGVDYGETFAPIARLDSIRILLAFASHHGFKLEQMDVKSDFLNGPLLEEVYVKQPPGFEDPHFPEYVFKLNMALYGLKQASRALYEHLSVTRCSGGDGGVDGGDDDDDDGDDVQLDDDGDGVDFPLGGISQIHAGELFSLRCFSAPREAALSILRNSGA